MKFSSFVSGSVMVVVVTFLIVRDLTDIKIKREGSIVYAQIVEKYSYRRSKTIEVRYHDQIISKNVPDEYWEDHTVGEIIQVQFLEGKDRVLLVNEEVGFSYFLIGFLLILTAFLFFEGRNSKSLKKSKSIRRRNYLAGKKS